MDLHTALKTHGLELPEPSAAKGLYRPIVHHGQWLFLSGQLPLQADGSLLHPGVVGAEVSLEQAQAAARLACLNALSWINWAQTKAGANWALHLVKLQGFVVAVPGFTQHPQVLNGASGLLQQVFGDDHLPARTSVGVAHLPLGACVEVELTVAVTD